MVVIKMNLADSCILGTVTLMLIAMLIVTYRVYKIVKFGDLRLLLMLFFLDLALLGNIHS